ncbi:MAG: membrane protein insertion efficiency factor YidD [Elusimicrobiota bacterium]|nr:membrane protein insertion efficiency factor YidD [Endomicrobiia bacterium]MCX7910117.1 membrane protein insertion efficiency factor YidD [Endomicrobiia bacterium]MDW8165047.1 membrane protein insertion efficiency factor YidD [Elusimicrobiota bacterium]
MKEIFKFIIKLYQKYISIFLGRHCRFFPTCSEYAVICLDKYGVVLGLYKTFLRIIKCHPFNCGGVDFP